MWIVVVAFAIPVIGGIIAGIVKSNKESKLKKAYEESALQIVSLYNKNNPNERLNYRAFEKKVSKGNSTYEYGFDTFFSSYNPAESDNWSDDDIKRYYALLTNYDNRKSNYLMERHGIIPSGETFVSPELRQRNRGVSGERTVLSPTEQKRILDIAASTGMKKPESAAGAMVKGAVVGKVIAGDAGAVVGAMVAKEKHDEKNK
ncbi:hypothetical protein LJC34_02505 [Oscillospiraceae bacterium OttesenSCG-928-G22]|nr:hypothetical protein [Oscillospiraceae bacterium OttesenSCG-928-G22]